MVEKNMLIEPQDHSDFIICLQKALIILNEEQEKLDKTDSSREEY